MSRFEIFKGIFVEVDPELYTIKSAFQLQPTVTPQDFQVSLDLIVLDVVEQDSNKTSGIIVVRNR